MERKRINGKTKAQIIKNVKQNESKKTMWSLVKHFSVISSVIYYEFPIDLHEEADIMPDNKSGCIKMNKKTNPL